MSEREDDMLEQVLRSHFSEVMRGKRGMAEFRFRAALAREENEALSTTGFPARGPAPLVPARTGWGRFIAVSMGSAVAACLATVWVLGVVGSTAREGIRPQPNGPIAPAITVGNSADKPAYNLQPLQRQVIKNELHDEGTMVLPNGTVVRRYRQDMQERVIMFDPARQAYVQVVVPRQQILLIPEVKQ